MNHVKPDWNLGAVLRVTVVAITMMASSVLAAFAANPALNGAECYSVKLEEELEWPTSGAWTRGGDQTLLLVVDTMRSDGTGEVLEITPFGDVAPRFGPETGIDLKSLFGAGRFRIHRPTHLRAAADGRFVLLDDGREPGEDEPGVPAQIVALDERLAVSSQLKLMTTKFEAKSGRRQGERVEIYGGVRHGRIGRWRSRFRRCHGGR